jgi:hypothetical protein
LLPTGCPVAFRYLLTVAAKILHRSATKAAGMIAAQVWSAPISAMRKREAASNEQS